MTSQHSTRAPSHRGASTRRVVASALLSMLALAPGPATAAGQALPAVGAGVWALAGAIGGALATVIAAIALRGRLPGAESPAAPTQLPWHLEPLLDALPCAAFVKDDQGRYLAVNRAYADLYRCHPDDVVGQTLAQTRHLHGDDGDAMERAEAALALDGRRAAAEIQHPPLPGQGSLRLLSLQLHVLPAHGGSPGVTFGTLLDVTAVRDARKASEAAAHTTDTFLSIMGHEIRTPIAGALGIVELLAQTSLDQEQVHLLGMLEESVDTLQHILGDILDFSRIESGRLTVSPVPCDLRVLADGVVALFAPQAAEKGLRLYASADWRLAAEYRCDAARMRQVLANLVSNAIKFTGRGHVELRIEMVDAVDAGQRLRFTVSDTGPGMSPELIRRTMEPFFHTPGARASGSGLGLALCRQLAQLMGGTLVLSSEPDEGTEARLEVVMPVLRPLVPRPDMAGRVALLCTADARLGHGLANGLSALGFNLIEAAPGELADIGADDAHLFLADAALVAAGGLPSGARCIRIVDPAEPVLAGPGEQGCVELPGIPLLWRAMVKACHAALGLAVPDPATDAAPAANAHAARILVAEDHPINRAVISRQLQRLGYPHQLVENGEQALQALDRERFDLLLTDCRMPFLDGYGLASRIRAAERGGSIHLPILALSASVLPGQAQCCTDAGMDGFLSKPLQLHELELQLAAHLRRAAAQAPSASPRPMPISAAPAAPADVSGYRQLGLLMEAFGSLRQVRDVLQRLLDTSRQDIAILDEALHVGDVREQRELLHRIGGSLRLLGGHEAHESPAPGRSNRQQRDALVRRLDSLEELLASLDPQDATVDGG